MGADDALLAKLEGMNQEATALEEQLLTPEVASDGLRYSKLAQELSPLKKLVEPYRQYRKTLEELAGAQEMLELEDDEEMKELATEEIETLTQRREELIEQVREAFVSNDPMADRNVIVEVRAGAGGDQSPSDVGGFKEVIFRIKGVGAFQRLQFESGGHRVQRVPKTETQGRIHTSMATVGVMPEAEDVDVEIKSEDLRIDTMRAGGPGGQHVNKTESAVRIVHLPTGIEVKCKEKSQHQNRAQAMRLLRAKLFEHEQQKIVQERGELRRTLIGSGDRSARVRTYNVPQNRVTDHRIELTLYDLANILDGAVDPFVEALVERDKQDKLAAL
jgi:peptide chain release factor 1